MNRSDIIALQARARGWSLGAELGVLDGANHERILRACPALHLIGVDLWEPTPGYEEYPHVENEAAARAVSNKFVRRSTLLKMSTAEAAAQVDDGTLDFVFIDADHSTEGVTADITNWTPKLKPAGWLMGHDIDWSSVQDAVAHLPYKKTMDTVWYVDCSLRLPTQ